MSDEHLQQQLFDEQQDRQQYATDSDNQLSHQHDSHGLLVKSEGEGIEYQDNSHSAAIYRDVSDNGVAVQDTSDGHDNQGHDLPEPIQGFVIREQDRWLPIANGKLSVAEQYLRP